MDAALGAGVQANPFLGFLLQAAGAGAFVGTLAAYRRRRKDESFDTFPIVTRWSTAGSRSAWGTCSTGQ
jgi:hypothetical protein